MGCDRWNDCDLGPRRFQTANVAIQIFRQANAICGLHKLKDPRCFRMSNNKVRHTALRFKTSDNFFVVINGSADSEPSN